MAISELYGKEIRYCSNRKEVKDHGDTGILLGSKLKDGDRVVIIEDVTTSGKSIEETYPIIKAQADVTVRGLMVSLNRMEKGLSSINSNNCRSCNLNSCILPLFSIILFMYSLSFVAIARAARKLSQRLYNVRHNLLTRSASRDRNKKS